LRVEDSLGVALQSWADEERRSLGQLVRLILEDAVAARGQSPKRQSRPARTPAQQQAAE
jgi:hypothetical protein